MKKNYLNNDFTFKHWFKIMWHNFFIQLVFIFAILLTLEIIYFDGVIAYIKESFKEGFLPSVLTVFCSVMPLLAIILISYLGFYKFWLSLKNVDND